MHSDETGTDIRTRPSARYACTRPAHSRCVRGGHGEHPLRSPAKLASRSEPGAAERYGDRRLYSITPICVRSAHAVAAGVLQDPFRGGRASGLVWRVPRTRYSMRAQIAAALVREPHRDVSGVARRDSNEVTSAQDRQEHELLHKDIQGTRDPRLARAAEPRCEARLSDARRPHGRPRRRTTGSNAPELSLRIPAIVITQIAAS